MSSPVLFIAADPRECAHWVAKWSDVSDPGLPVHWARAGNWKGASVIAIANGAGWQRAASAVSAAGQKPKAVFNIGFCGALDASLEIGQVFVATEIHGNGTRFTSREPDAKTKPSSGVLASVPRIAQSAAEKETLRKSGAKVVEMEAAGVARASEELSVPFYCVRAVSDLANEDFANDFNKFLMPDGRFNVLGLIFHALQNPVVRFRELIRLSKRTALASKNLGEFLATCSY